MASKNISLFLFLFFLLCGHSLQAQNPDSSHFQVNRSTAPVTIDGNPSEPDWQNSPEADHLLYLHTDRSLTDSIQTSVKLLFDESRLYIAFICRDEHPERILADARGRDLDIRSNDSVYLLLDTGSSRTFYYYFGINPLSSRLDGRIAKTGFPNESTWNGKWEAAAQKVESGWTAEAAIDLTSLGIDTEKGPVIRLSLSRVVPRLDSLFWSGPLDPAFDLGDPQLFKSIQLPAPLKSLAAQAYVMPRSRTGDGTTASLGADIRDNPSDRLSAHLSFFPEFDTIEPDEEQINLTLFELRLDEKREYFSESQPFFQQPLQLFYSKRIGPLYGSLKFQGISGPARYAGITSQSDPGSQSHTANTSALRIESKPADGLTLGGTAVNIYSNSQAQGAAGTDFQWNAAPSLLFTSQFAYSYGKFSRQNTAFLINAEYRRPSFTFTLSWKQLEKYFQDNSNAVGYILDDDRREITASLTKEFPFNLFGLQRLIYDADYDIYWSTEGILRRWETNQKLAVRFKDNWLISVHHRRDYTLNPVYPDELVKSRDTIYPDEWMDFKLSLEPLPYFDPERAFHLFNPVIGDMYHYYKGKKHYHGFLTAISSSFFQNENNNFILSYQTGRFLAQDYTLFEAFKDITFAQNVSASLKITRLQYKFQILPAYQNAWIYLVNGGWDNQKNFRFDIFLQQNTSIKKLNLQVKFLYRIWPLRGAIQVVWQRGLSPFGIQGTEGQAVYLKFIYTL